MKSRFLARQVIVHVYGDNVGNVIMLFPTLNFVPPYDFSASLSVGSSHCFFTCSYVSINIVTRSFIFQGLKVFDDSVESFTSGAWQAFGNALKGGTSLVQKYVSFNLSLFY